MRTKLSVINFGILNVRLLASQETNKSQKLTHTQPPGQQATKTTSTNRCRGFWTASSVSVDVQRTDHQKPSRQEPDVREGVHQDQARGESPVGASSRLNDIRLWICPSNTLK